MGMEPKAIISKGIRSKVVICSDKEAFERWGAAGNHEEWKAVSKEQAWGSWFMDQSAVILHLLLSVVAISLLNTYLLSRALWLQHHRISELQNSMPRTWSLCSLQECKLHSFPFLLDPFSHGETWSAIAHCYFFFFQEGYKMQDLRSTYKMWRLSHVNNCA